ncbi:hypothetical protein ACHAWF_013915 [Thalassiosira exigua]
MTKRQLSPPSSDSTTPRASVQKSQGPTARKQARTTAAPSAPDQETRQTATETITATTTTTTMTMIDDTSPPPAVTWGDWMGAHKTGADVDQESERIDRQKAAFGGDTIARLKDLNVLIVGCAGVGVETAKNLILSNVGGVALWDEAACEEVHRGSNFYVTSDHVLEGASLAEASLGELRSLNPFCRVGVLAGGLGDEVLLSKDVLGTHRPYAAVVVTKLLPKDELFRLNETARANGIAFVMAVTNGVTSSIFSDFGPRHEITDATGEPTQTLAVSNVEVIAEKPRLLQVDGVKDGDKVVIVTVAQSDHGLEDGDMVVLEDMREGMEGLNGKSVTVKRVALLSPTAALVDTRGVAFKSAIALPTASVISNFERQYDFYKSAFDEGAENVGKKFPARTITIFNRLALVLDGENGEKLLQRSGIASIDIFGEYQSGGLLNQVRPPIVKQYRSLAETLEKTPVPQMLRGEDWELGKGVDVHLSISAALEFNEKNGHWPRLHNSDDASQLVQLSKEISNARKSIEGACWSQNIQYGFAMGEPRDLDEKRISRYSRLFMAELSGFCAFLGGAAAQEVIKATGKFTPIDQTIHHDEVALVGDECKSNISPLFGSRYDHQIAIMGKDFQARLANQRIFLVGCGALGCEYLKGLALMGAGSGKDGKIWVTDMDRIEVSNLSRQFLFRQDDVGHPKSVRGALVVKRWNPSVNIEALEKKVGPESKNFFMTHFGSHYQCAGMHLTMLSAESDGALSFLTSSKWIEIYVQGFSLVLTFSGTLGTKCNHEVILPFRTSSYNDGEESDDNEAQIAMCTLSFVLCPINFEFGPSVYEEFRQDPGDFLVQLASMEPVEQSRSLRMTKAFIDLQEEAGGKIDFKGCVQIAFNRMVKDFRTSILDLCHSANEMEKSSGQKFWTGTKRRPRPVDWTKPIPLLMEYLFTTANLYASVWQVAVVRNRDDFQAIVDEMGLEQPRWEPSGEKADLSKGDEEAGNYGMGNDVKSRQSRVRWLYADDLNFHIDFLTAATNMRSWNYDIKSSARHAVKVTAGRIIPALATTTAMVCGLVDIEFCKLVLGIQVEGSEKFLNSNINLAAGSGNFTTFSPDPPIQISTGLESPHPQSFTSWDKIELQFKTKELSVEQLVQYVSRSYGVTIDRIFLHDDSGDKAIYNALDRNKLDWSIDFEDNGKVTVSEGVFTQWPQLRMAVQMLGRLPSGSGQRAIFKSQVEKVKGALDQTKESFVKKFEGPVSKAYYQVYRPSEDGEKQDYFESVFRARDYVTLGVDCHTDTEEDITLPRVKYIFTHSKE